jgi:hypothetical protein
MANALHVAKLRDGARAWNAWKGQHSDIIPDLSALSLSAGLLQFGPVQGGPIDLSAANLRGAALGQATLVEANLAGATLVDADLTHARLQGANLAGADLRGANLDQADMKDARLGGANLAGARLSGVRNLVQAQIEEALGDRTTVLPVSLVVPRNWVGLTTVARLASDTGAADPYATLGVGHGASARAIRVAYLRLVKELHPDGRADDPEDHTAEERLKAINEAYRVLRSRGRRAGASTGEHRSRARGASFFFLIGALLPSAILAGTLYWLGEREPMQTAAIAESERRRPAGSEAYSPPEHEAKSLPESVKAPPPRAQGPLPVADEPPVGADARIRR